MYKFLNLKNALRAVAILMMIVLAGQYFVGRPILAVPVVTVAILLILSFTFDRWPRTSAALALVPGFFIPVSVLIGFLGGMAPLALLIFDMIIFSWIVVSATIQLFFTARE